MNVRFASPMHTSSSQLFRREGQSSTVIIKEISKGHAMREQVVSEFTDEMEGGYLKRPDAGEVWESASSPQKKLKSIASSAERKK